MTTASVDLGTCQFYTGYAGPGGPACGAPPEVWISPRGRDAWRGYCAVHRSYADERDEAFDVSRRRPAQSRVAAFVKGAPYGIPKDKGGESAENHRRMRECIASVSADNPSWDESRVIATCKASLGFTKGSAHADEVGANHEGTWFHLKREHDVDDSLLDKIERGQGFEEWHRAAHGIYAWARDGSIAGELAAWRGVTVSKKTVKEMAGHGCGRCGDQGHDSEGCPAKIDQEHAASARLPGAGARTAATDEEWAAEARLFSWEQAERRMREGVWSQPQWEAFAYAWRRGAPRLTDQGAGYEDPHPDARELAERYLLVGDRNRTAVALDLDRSEDDCSAEDCPWAGVLGRHEHREGPQGQAYVKAKVAGDLETGVAINHRVPIELITDHLGNLLAGAEPATCAVCGQPMQLHSQWNPTRQRLAVGGRAACSDCGQEFEDADLYEGRCASCDNRWLEQQYGGPRTAHEDHGGDSMPKKQPPKESPAKAPAGKAKGKAKGKGKAKKGDGKFTSDDAAKATKKALEKADAILNEGSGSGQAPPAPAKKGGAAREAQAGTSVGDLVDWVPDFEPYPDGLRPFIVDHEAELLERVEPATCAVCGEAFSLHSRFRPTRQRLAVESKGQPCAACGERPSPEEDVFCPECRAAYDAGQPLLDEEGEEERTRIGAADASDWPPCEGCGEPLSPVVRAMDSTPYCTDCIRQGRIAERPQRGRRAHAPSYDIA